MFLGATLAEISLKLKCIIFVTKSIKWSSAGVKSFSHRTLLSQAHGRRQREAEGAVPPLDFHT